MTGISMLQKNLAMFTKSQHTKRLHLSNWRSAGTPSRRMFTCDHTSVCPPECSEYGKINSRSSDFSRGFYAAHTDANHESIVQNSNGV